MKKKMNKKGAEISLNFIIIAILGVIALIGIVFFFLGGAKFFAQKEKGTVLLTDQDISLAEAACDLHCSFGNKDKWDSPLFPESITKASGSWPGYSKCETLMSRPDISSPKDWDINCVAPVPQAPTAPTA